MNRWPFQASSQSRSVPMKPQFKATSDGFVIADPIERLQYQILTKTPVSLEATDNDQTPYPMDAAVIMKTSGLSIPDENSIYVRYADGTLCTDIHPDDRTTLPKAQYLLDISGPIKVYVYVDSEVEVRYDSVEARTNINFDSGKRIIVSARSFHRRPVKTITTTPNPEDLMTAVSAFSSSLKTTATEHSYPTFRGHPPNIKIGDELSIPDGIEWPQTGIRLEVPPTLRHIFTITPLAYYLAANVVPGSKPRIVTESGWEYPLTGQHGFEKAVERVFKQVFLLDCIVRTEGETPGPIHERQALEAKLKFDVKSTYGKPIIDRLEIYLQEPYSAIQPQIPDWYPEVYLKSTEDCIEFLPFIANDLATVKVKSEEELSDQVVGRESSSADEVKSGRFVPLLQQSWQSKSGTDVLTAKPLAAVQNSITQSPRDGPLRVDVVCNSAEMNEELISVNGIYGEQYDLPFDVTAYHDLTKNELREILAREGDFFHYIGHINTNGFECTDGTLNAANVERVRQKAFFLNACQSYEQGINLIKAGSIGGLATLTDIGNNSAVVAGSLVAQMLNNGYPLYSVIHVLRREFETGHQYRILGDEKLVVSQSNIGIPMTAEIMQGDGELSINITPYVTSKCELGSICTPYISSIDEYYLIPREINIPQISKAELIDFLNKGDIPVIFENELRWSTEIKTSEL